MKLKLYKCTSEDGKTWHTLAKDIIRGAIPLTCGHIVAWQITEDAVKVEYVSDVEVDLSHLIENELKPLKDRIESLNKELDSYWPWHFGLYERR